MDVREHVHALDERLNSIVNCVRDLQSRQSRCELRSSKLTRDLGELTTVSESAKLGRLNDAVERLFNIVDNQSSKSRNLDASEVEKLKSNICEELEKIVAERVSSALSSL